MEKYKRKVKRRFWICISLAVVLIIIAAVWAVAEIGQSEWAAALPAFGVSYFAGICGGGIGTMAYMAQRQYHVLRSPAALKKAYIEETDERLALVRQKSGEAAFLLQVGGLSAAAFVCMFINTAVFTTLIVAVIFIALVRLATKIYYFRKLG